MSLRKKLANHSSNQQYSLGLYQQWYCHFPSKIPGRWTGTMHDDAMWHMPRRWRNMKIMAVWPHGLQGFWPRIILKYIEVRVFRVASKRGKQISGNNTTQLGGGNSNLLFFSAWNLGKLSNLTCAYVDNMFQMGWLKTHQPDNIGAEIWGHLGKPWRCQDLNLYLEQIAVGNESGICSRDDRTFLTWAPRGSVSFGEGPKDTCTFCSVLSQLLQDVIHMWHRIYLCQAGTSLTGAPTSCHPLLARNILYLSLLPLSLQAHNYMFVETEIASPGFAQRRPPKLSLIQRGETYFHLPSCSYSKRPIWRIPLFVRDHRPETIVDWVYSLVGFNYLTQDVYLEKCVFITHQAAKDQWSIVWLGTFTTTKYYL